MLRVHRLNDTSGYSFLEHGGMWADVFIVSPLVAYLVNKYAFAYGSSMGWWILLIALLLWVALALFVFAPSGKNMPEAHARDGRVTGTGWIHVVYATLTMWVIAMAYIPGMVSPTISNKDVWIMSVALSVWAYFGVVKFSPAWFVEWPCVIQIIVEVVGLWILAIWRTW